MAEVEAPANVNATTLATSCPGAPLPTPVPRTISISYGTASHAGQDSGRLGLLRLSSPQGSLSFGAHTLLIDPTGFLSQTTVAVPRAGRSTKRGTLVKAFRPRKAQCDDGTDAHECPRSGIYRSPQGFPSFCISLFKE